MNHQPVKKQTSLVMSVPRRCDFKEIRKCKISIKGEIASRNAFLLHKTSPSTFVCQQIHKVCPFFLTSYISCFNDFQNFITLWYKDLNNYTDLHKLLPKWIWVESICLWEL